MTNAQEHDYSI